MIRFPTTSGRPNAGMPVSPFRVCAFSIVLSSFRTSVVRVLSAKDSVGRRTASGSCLAMVASCGDFAQPAKTSANARIQRYDLIILGLTVLLGQRGLVIWLRQEEEKAKESTGVNLAASQGGSASSGTSGIGAVRTAGGRGAAGSDRSRSQVCRKLGGKRVPAYTNGHTSSLSRRA